MVHYIYGGVKGYDYQIKTVFLSLKIIFVLENSVDPDKMLHYVTFYLGLHCLPEYAFRSH